MVSFGFGILIFRFWDFNRFAQLQHSLFHGWFQLSPRMNSHLKTLQINVKIL